MRWVHNDNTALTAQVSRHVESTNASWSGRRESAKGLQRLARVSKFPPGHLDR